MLRCFSTLCSLLLTFDAYRYILLNLHLLHKTPSTLFLTIPFCYPAFDLGIEVVLLVSWPRALL